MRYDELNIQDQQKNVWPAVPVVARAYLDQLNRDHAIQPARAAAVKTALDAADKVRTGTDKGATSIVAAARQGGGRRGAGRPSATGRDQARFKALADTMKGIGAKLK